MQMDNKILPQSRNNFLKSLKNDEGITKITFTMDVSGIRELLLLYGLIDKLKERKKHFINYSMRGDADEQQ